MLLSFGLDFMTQHSDPRTREWFLIGSAWTPIVLLVIYIWICVYLGPELMQNRSPIKLNTFLRYYNFLILVLNGGLVIYFLYYQVVLKYSPICQPVNTSGSYELMMAKGFYVFFLSKIFELTDSLVIIMKKKENPQSSLHYYHHASMLLNAWLGVRFLPGGSSVIVATVNTFFHFITYLYYHLASLNCGNLSMAGFRDVTTYSQFIQFGLVILHCTAASIKGCGYPRSVLLWLIFYVATFLCFFYLCFFTNESSGSPTVQNPALNTLQPVSKSLPVAGLQSSDPSKKSPSKDIPADSNKKQSIPNNQDEKIVKESLKLQITNNKMFKKEKETRIAATTLSVQNRSNTFHRQRLKNNNQSVEDCLMEFHHSINLSPYTDQLPGASTNKSTKTS